AAYDLKTTQLKIISKDKYGVTLAFDGWKNVAKQSLLGSILITSDGKTIVWKADDISGIRSCWPDIIAKTKNLLLEIEKEGIQINAV
ncbi:9704_t:CDS:1, partial [Acaulospora morrowiae]